MSTGTKLSVGIVRQVHGHLWLDIGSLSFPLSLHYDEEGNRYAYFWDDETQREERIYVQSEAV